MPPKLEYGLSRWSDGLLRFFVDTLVAVLERLGEAVRGSLGHVEVQDLLAVLLGPV